MGNLVTRRANRDAATVDECCPAVLAAPLSEDAATVLAGHFAVLADPVRLRLLSLLASAPTGEACVCELVEPVERSQPTVSHHLRILTDAGLIVGEKRGRWVWYRALPSRLAEMRDALA